MSQYTKKQKQLYDFLCSRCGKEFSINDVIMATGYKESTIETYFRKKLLNYWVAKYPDGYSTTDEFESIKIDEFIDHMNQTSRKCRNKSL